MKGGWIPRIYNCRDVILIMWRGYEITIRKWWQDNTIW